VPHRFVRQPFNHERVASELEELAEFVGGQISVNDDLADRLRAGSREPWAV